MFMYEQSVTRIPLNMIDVFEPKYISCNVSPSTNGYSGSYGDVTAKLTRQTTL